LIFSERPVIDLGGSRIVLSGLPVDMDEAAAAQMEVDDPTKAVDGVVLLGHSTALSGHLVSPINPRAILISRDTWRRRGQCTAGIRGESGHGTRRLCLLKAPPPRQMLP
jgi:hypothetical protein